MNPRIKKFIIIIFYTLIIIGVGILLYLYVPIMRNPAPDYMRAQGLMGTQTFNGYLYNEPGEQSFYKSRVTLKEYFEMRGVDY